MVKIQKPIPKKLENKPKLDNPIKKKKQQQKKEKSSTKNTKLLDDSTPIEQAKVSLKPGKGDIAKKQPNEKDLNGEKKIEKKPLILAPQSSPEQKKIPKGKQQNKNKGKNGVNAVAESSENSVKNGVKETAKPTVVPQKNNKKQSKLAEKVAKSIEVLENANNVKPAKSDNKIKLAAKTGPAVEQKKLVNPVTASTKEGKKKNNKKSAKLTPAIEKIKKVQKPKVALQENKKVKAALKKAQNTGPDKPQYEKEQSAFRYDPIPYDEERFNSIVNVENIKKIAEALKTTVEAEVKTKKSSIFDDYGYFLQVCSFKIPVCPKRVVKLNLTHSLVDKDDDILLVVPDLQRGIKADYENTKHHYEDLLKQNGVEGITVMPMNQLRKEHGSFEQRRKLCASYDYFLSDGRILGHVGKLIGKLTQKPRNTIHSVRFNEKKNLKAEIEKALKRTAYRQLSKGSLQTIPVGTHKHSSEQVAENIVSVVEQLKNTFPGGMGNVRNLHLRINLIGTSSLPLYISMAQAPEKTPEVIGPKEQRLLKLKKEANDVLAKFTMTKDGKLVKLTKPAAERKRKLQEMAAALKEGQEESAKKAKKDPNDQGEKTSKKNVKEVKELELPENEEEDDDTSDEGDEDAVQLGQGSDDEETEDDDMANLDEEDTESGAEIVENGLVDEDDEESEENDGQEVNQGENDDDDEDDEDDEDDDDDEDEDDEEESD